MNLLILRALFEDARQQVLDNRVFRLLVLLTAIPILLTFLVGFHEESISVLWGWKVVTYEEMLKSFGGTGQLAVEELSVTFIQGLQMIIVEVFVGTFGMMLCIAATAFFAPKILEKGSADTLFSKPVSRMAILLSRYFAGILFVAFLSLVLVLGMYLGFLVNSGYNDPGFLWGALTLVYLYSMMHAFSVAVAVFTRSSTAAILMTIFLFMLCGAVHGGWLTMHFTQEQSFISQLRSSGDDEEEGEEEETSSFVSTLVTTLDVLHYVLPKTSDADIITQKLRRAVMGTPAVIATEDDDFVLTLGPAGFTADEASLTEFEGAGVRWVSNSDNKVQGTITARRYKRPETTKTVASKTRTRLGTSKDAANAWEDELEAGGFETETENESISAVRALVVHWTTTEESTIDHSRYFLHFGDWLYEIELNLQGYSPETEPIGYESEDYHHARWYRGFIGRGNIVLGKIKGMRPDTWYASVFTMDAELKYNVMFSIGSSLAFIVAMLTLAWLKLRRIDF